MASAAGLALIPAEKRNPFHTTTFGVGELILKAASRGCNKIIIGLGGSATNDGAAGVMQALGFQLLDKNKKPIKNGAEGLLSLEEIKTGSRNENLDKIEFIVACDVENPLLGKYGASYTYAQQKGALPDQLPLFEKSLSRYNEIIIRDLHQSVANIPGSGAAGGMGAGLMAFLNATLKPGFDIIKDYTQIERCLQRADVVITGEGCIDSQTIYGKLPVGIGRLGKKHNVPVFAFVGEIGENIDAIYENGITSIFSIVERPMELKESIECAATLLYRTTQRFTRIISAFKVDKRGG
jgi:glycerate kinase